MKGVVLAAGVGRRLRPMTLGRPKVLLPVRDKPLISYPIEALVSAGITEIAVVVGYQAPTVMAELGDGSRFGGRLKYVVNPHYWGGNALSVRCLKQWTAGEPFVLCMGDHIIEPALVSRLLATSFITETLCVDLALREGYQAAEATKVLVDARGCIQRIGKELISWNALDTGAFLLTHRFIEAIEELFPERGFAVEISDVIRWLVSRGHRFATCEVTGCFWADVDTEEDFNLVGA